MRLLINVITITMMLACMSMGAVTAQAQKQRTTKSTKNASEEQAYNINAVKYNAEAGDPAALNQLGVWLYTGQHVGKDIPQAVEMWRQAALLGNPKAIANLGICYQYGTGVAQDSVNAMRLYAKAIADGQHELLRQRQGNLGKNAFDGVLVGICREKGIGTERDVLSAAEAYASSADLGSTDAAAFAARCYSEGGNMLQAKRYAEQATKAGNTLGTAILGELLVDGRGVTPFISQGIDYLMTAARKGDTRATNKLAQLMLSGTADLGGKVTEIANMTAAVAEAGNVEAMVNYARALIDGVGVPNDYQSGLFWLAQASAAGATAEVDMALAKAPQTLRSYLEACNKLQAGDYAAATKILKQLEKKKIPDVAILQAKILADPKNPKAKPDEAIKKLQKLAGKDPRAAYELAQIYENEYPRNDDAMMAMYLRAANNGCGEAQSRLGDIYYEGQIVGADHALAARYYSDAYARRTISDLGARRLAEMLRDGAYGVAPDPIKAAALDQYKAVKP